MSLDSMLGVYRKIMDKYNSWLDKPMSRRELFRQSLPMIAAVVGGLSFIANNYPLGKEQKPQDTKPLVDPYPTSPVKKYSSQIAKAADDMLPELYGDFFGKEGEIGYRTLKMMIGNGAGAVATIGATMKNDPELTELLFILSGISTASHRILDKASTIKFADTMRDPRFKEYGLDEFYVELNPRLPPHPTPQDLLSPSKLYREAINVVSGAISPPVGFFALMDMWDVPIHNLHVDFKMRLAMELGDKVKERLARNQSHAEITDFLANVSYRDLRPNKNFFHEAIGI